MVPMARDTTGTTFTWKNEPAARCAGGVSRLEAVAEVVAVRLVAATNARTFPSSPSASEGPHLHSSITQIRPPCQQRAREVPRSEPDWRCLRGLGVTALVCSQIPSESRLKKL